MNEIALGGLLLIAGLGLTFMGLRVFMLLLPVFGFISGFFLGASLVASWLDEGFLTTIAEWTVGIILGVLFAALSYLYWYVGAILAAASVGAVIGMMLMAALGVDSERVIWLAAFIAGGLFGLLALILRLPIYVVMVNTAIGGAIITVTSVLLIFDQVEAEQLRWGAAWATINTSWVWWLLTVVLAAVGIAVQWRRMLETPLPEERWVRADARARRTAAINNDVESRM